MSLAMQFQEVVVEIKSVLASGDDHEEIRETGNDITSVFAYACKLDDLVIEQLSWGYFLINFVLLVSTGLSLLLLVLSLLLSFFQVIEFIVRYEKSHFTELISSISTEC
jgi:hypothetical protein